MINERMGVQLTPTQRSLAHRLMIPEHEYELMLHEYGGEVWKEDAEYQAYLDGDFLFTPECPCGFCHPKGWSAL